MTSNVLERSRSRQAPLFVTASTVYRSRSDRAIASLLAESWSTTSTRMRESYRCERLAGSAADHGFHILGAFTVLSRAHTVHQLWHSAHAPCMRHIRDAAQPAYYPRK